MALNLSDAHRQELEAGSGITPKLIEQRGYYTCTDPEDLIMLGFSEEQSKLVPCLVIPIYPPSSTTEPSTYQIKPDSPRLIDGKVVKYETPAGSQMRFDVSPNPAMRALLKDHNTPLWITEGIKKADSAAVRGLCCIGLLGVWNWRGKNDLGGIMALGEWEDIPLKGRIVNIAFDNDVMLKEQVRDAMRRLAAFLISRGAREVRCLVPAIPGHDGKLGLDDFFVAGGLADALAKLINNELLGKTKCRAVKVSGRPSVEICADAYRALVEANNENPTVFVRAGELVRVAIDKESGPKIKSVDHNRMRGILMRTGIKWYVLKESKGKDKEWVEVDVPPSNEIVYDLITLDTWPDIPTLINVTRCPVMSPDGVLNMGRGYCPSSKVWVDAEGDWPEFDGTAEDAVRFIFDEILAEFPFVSKADRAHALALMLLQIVRPFIAGRTPLHLFDAPTPGTGKSLLAKLCLMATAGTAIGSTPSGEGDEGEMRKFITAALLDGVAAIFYDNIEHKVDSPVLEQALTSPEWIDRRLQVSEIVKVPIMCTWVMTSNNAELGKAVTDRVLYIHLDARTEYPRERLIKKTGIEAWVMENRLMIVAALCKIVQSWIDAGLPRYTARHWGSFEEYTMIMGGILEHAGVEGFLDNVQELRDRADSAHASWIEFVGRWFKKHGSEAVTAGDLLPCFKEDEALAGILGANEAGHAGRLGKWLKKRADNVFQGLQVKVWTGARTNSIRYHVVAVTVGIPTILGESRLNPDNLFESNNRDNRDNRDFLRDTHVGAHDHAHDRTPAEPDIPIIPIIEPKPDSQIPIIPEAAIGWAGDQTPPSDEPPAEGKVII